VPAFDLLVRGGQVVQPAGVCAADIAVDAGRIVAIEPELAGSGREAVDARGLHVLPGVVDAHVHFNEPGRTTWEGFASGSRALAAGGGTTCLDMPLNNQPLTLDAASFVAKRRVIEAKSLVDFGLWGGLVPGNAGRLPELAGCGVVGVKAFMCDSGLPEFPPVDDRTLWEGMRAAAALGLVVAVHAESDALTRGLTQRIRAAGGRTVRDYLASRPVRAEVEAIQRAIQCARDTGAALHVVHVSSGRGAALVAEARAQGVDVTCETCPHYLLLTEEDAERLGAVAKCAPPLRRAAEQERLWEALAGGAVDLVASDHSPAPPAMKQGEDFFAVWGGIPGVQSTLPALLTHGYHGHAVALETIAARCAARPAQRFGLFPRKGTLAAGADADLILVALDETWRLEASDLLTRHQQSPYVGRTFRGRVRRTMRRGETIFAEGRPVTGGGGRFLRPDRSVGQCQP
jgi:allantoinase